MKNKLVSACFLLALIATAAILGLSVNIAPAQSATASYTFSGFIYDSTGNVAPNAHIYLINQANGRSAAQDYSDITGFYSMSVPSGTYNLVSRLIGSSQSYSKNNLVINGDTLMDISLVVGYKISGRVFDSSGRTVAGILTNVFNDEWTVPGVSSDASGYYTIYAPAGTYNLAFWPPLNSHLMTFVNNSFIVSSDMNYDVVMSSGFEVSGFVKYPSGDKVIGATTYLVNGSGYTFSSGRFTNEVWLSGGYAIVAPAGSYTILAKLNGVLIYSESNIALSGDITKDLTLSGVSISPSSAILDVGQSYTYTATVTGGPESGIYKSYTWYVDGVAKTTTSTPTFDFSPSEIGTYAITVVAKDNSGVSSTQSTTATATVNPALVASEVSASSEFIDRGQKCTLTATEASAGTGPYTYQWYVKAPSAQDYSLVIGATSLGYDCTSSSTTELGKWSFVLNATDSASNPNVVSSQAVSVWVNPPPAVSVSPELAILNEGSTKTFTAFTSGGSGSITYEWYLDNVKVGENSPSYLYIATSGTHTLRVKVTDSANPPLFATSFPVSITVNSPLTTPTASAVNSAIDQGQAFNLTATAAVNGTAPYTYQWFVKSPSGNYSALSAATSANCSIPTLSNVTTGVWYFVLYVTDSATVPVTVTSNVILVTVNSAPSVSISASTAAFTAGQSCTFTATAVNGSGAYIRYQWYVNGVAQAGQNSSTFTFSPSTAGSYSVTATVTDSLDATSIQSSTVAVEVSPAPTPTPAPTATPSSTPAATPTQTPTPSPTSTPTPNASTSSSSPTPTQDVEHGPDTGTYTIVSVVLAIVVVALIAVILMLKRTQKATKP